jgi:hypothetical protein
MNDFKCPDCSGPMEEGYIYDQGAPAHPQSSWVKGPPEPSYWFGLKTKPRVKVTTFRCEACGLLKSYARPTDRE